MLAPVLTVDCRADPDWLLQAEAAMDAYGCAIVTGVLDEEMLAHTREAMYTTQRKMIDEVGAERLERAGEIGVLRIMLRFDDLFFEFLELEPVLAFVDATLASTAILHVQNGLILPSATAKDVFQHRFHQDFPRVLNGYRMSVNAFFAIDDFSSVTGGTLLVPSSHQKTEVPSPEELRDRAVSAECPAGAMIVFDSTLWHAAGENTSGHDRLAINHQFTRSYVKQQIDFCRALPAEKILSRPERTQQLLGWYTRVVTSLDEYYRPTEQRLYRSGQG
jgi:ectoine hydroxylase-related dioxygenase (phytanoyl-CoA dioxygenase family)